MLCAKSLTKCYGEHKVLDAVSFHVEKGDFFGILGPNGSGKSTLLKLLSGVEKPNEGSLTLDGKPLGGYSRKQLSRRIAVLQQEPIPPVSFSVRDVVEMGRFPYQNWIGDEKDYAGGMVDSILAELDLIGLQNRQLDELSGGERQRVALGKAMAQEPDLLLLDEPTTYLDIGYQLQMMDRIQLWRKERNMTVIAVLHDLNLASMYCNRMLLLHHGQLAASGTPEDMLRSDLIMQIYGTEPVIVEHPIHGTPQILLQRGVNR